MTSPSFSVWLSIAVMTLATGAACADQVAVIAGGGFTELTNAFAPTFEAKTGHKITARYGTAPQLITMSTLDNIYQKLGIADLMKTNLRAQTSVPSITEAVATGDAEIAIFTLSVLATDPRMDVVGPIHDEVKNSVVYFGSTSSASKVPVAAQALLNFIKSPEAAAIIKSKGMTPG